MENSIPFIFSAVIGYLLGALPFAVIISKMHGVDIFTVGSKNPGATNVKRSVGKTAGNIVFALDCLKGVIAAYIPVLLLGGGTESFYGQITGLVFAVLGHSFSVFIRFRGGKGVATTIGGLIAIMPVPLAIGLAVWTGVFYASGYVSLASICLGLSLPVSNFFLKAPLPYTVFSVTLALFLVYRHRANIKRLIKGEENSFKKK